MPPRRARQPAQPAQPQPAQHQLAQGADAQEIAGSVVASLADPVGGDLVNENELGVGQIADGAVRRAIQLLTERMDDTYRAIRAEMRQTNENISRRLFNNRATRNDIAIRVLLPEPSKSMWSPASRADLYDMSRVQVDALLAHYGVDVPAGANLRERRIPFGMFLGVAL